MPGENRTHNSALGGRGYIHLTTDTYSVFTGYSNTHFGELFSPWSPNRSPNFILAVCRIATTHDFEQFSHCFAPFWWVHIRNSTPLGGGCYIHLTTEAEYSLAIYYTPFSRLCQPPYDVLFLLFRNFFLYGIYPTERIGYFPPLNPR